MFPFFLCISTSFDVRVYLVVDLIHHIRVAEIYNGIQEESDTIWPHSIIHCSWLPRTTDPINNYASLTAIFHFWW